MSEQTISSAHQYRRQQYISRNWLAGIIVGMASFGFFALAAERLNANGFVATQALILWSHQDPGLMGGRWIQLVLISLIKAIPASNVTWLEMVTIFAVAALQALVTHDFVKRGWSPLQASLAVGLTTLHPITINLAVGGSPLLMYVSLAGLTIIVVDRFEAISDTQSLIVLGFMLALLSIAWPDAVFFILPLITLLPWAFKEIKSYGAAVALFVIALTPMLICLSAVALAGTIFNLPFSDILSIWSSPLHGEDEAAIQASSWLASYGGKPIQAFLLLFMACIALVPAAIVIVMRFVVARHERAKPVTGVAALFLPAVAGGLATLFYQLESLWVVMSLSLACAAAWATTVHFRNWERWVLIALISINVALAWAMPTMWSVPADASWRHILLGGV